MRARDGSPRYFQTSLRTVAYVALLIPLLIAVGTLAGWAFDVPILTGWGLSGASMKVNTALLLVIAATSLSSSLWSRDRHVSRTILAAGGVLVATAGALTLSQYIFDVDLGIDQLLVSAINDPNRGRMSFITAMNFVALGMAMVLLALKRTMGIAAAVVLATFVVSAALAATAGLVIDANAAYRGGIYMGLSPGTVVCQICLASAVLTLAVLGNQLDLADLTFERSLTLTSLLLFLAAAGTVAAYAATMRLDRTVSMSEQTTSTAKSLIVTIQDAERGQRGYLLTGDQKYLAPYDQAKGSLSIALWTLRNLEQSDSVQFARLDRLEDFVGQKMAELDRTINLQRAGRTDEARALVAEGTGQQFMNELRAQIAEFIETEESRSSRFRNAAELGQFSALVFSFFALLGTAGLTTGARKRAQKALSASETRFSQVFEYAGLGMALVGLDGRWMRVNEHLAHILGYTKDELESMTFQQITVPEDLEEDLTYVQDLLAGRRDEYSMQKRYLRKDGSVIWAQLTVTLMRKPDGSPEQFISMIEDITERTRYEDALKASEREHRELANAMPQLVWIADANGAVLLFNERQSQYRNVGLGPTSWHGLIHPEDRLKTIEAWAGAVRDGANYQIEHRLLMADGSYAWHLTRAAPTRDRAGKILKWNGTSTNIHDHKMREQHIQLLMGEVNHRSKNLLAVSQAIARHTASSAGNVVEFANHFSARLAGLAASQDILINQDWRGAPLSELIKSQLGHYGKLIGTRILIGGPDLLLSPVATQTLGMAFHELSTNAAKYGALSNERGTINISWTRRENGGETKLKLAWIEAGGPPVIAPENKGFGQIVLDRMLTQRLGGQVELDYAESGFKWSLEVELQAIVSNVDGVRAAESMAS